MTRRLLAIASLAIASISLAACAITADDHPHPITRESTTTTEATGP